MEVKVVNSINEGLETDFDLANQLSKSGLVNIPFVKDQSHLYKGGDNYYKKGPIMTALKKIGCSLEDVWNDGTEYNVQYKGKKYSFERTNYGFWRIIGEN